MATKEQHLAEVTRNESLASRLAEMREYGWALTLLFYASVHLIQAYLVEVGDPAATHAARETQLKRRRPLGPVINHYDALKKDSEAARYDCHSFTESEYQRAQIRYGRLQGHMQRLLS